MLNNVSLDSLKVFYEVANYKNISQASKALFVSQPAITQTINKLENQLNQKLFIRKQKGVELTSIGQKLYEQVALSLSGLRKITDIVYNFAELKMGELKIGCGTNLAKAVLLQPITNFLKKYPNIKIVMLDIPSSDLHKKLATSEIDIYFAQQNHVSKPVTFNEIFAEEYVLIQNKNSKLNVDKLLDINNKCLILQNEFSSSRKFINDILTLHNITPSLLHEISGYNMILEMVKNNIGCSIVPNYIAKSNELSHNLKITSLKEFESKKTIFGYFINKNHISKSLNEFLKFII